MNRRSFLSRAGLGVAAAARSARAKNARPNILFAIADDWGWPFAPAYGDRVVKTPTFDRVAGEGVLFTNAFCASPSCTPSRGAILTGRTVHSLKEGGNLWSALPKDFPPVYTDLLQAAGYRVGLERKGWGPGTIEGSGRGHNPAGPPFRNFREFFEAGDRTKPFCYWFGSQDPHRPYEKGSGLAAGMRLEDVKVPPHLPDTQEVRSDILDYYFEVQRFDRETGEILQILEKAGQLENTLVVITGDNGMPFPRAKANVYNYGTHQPLAARWPARFKGGRKVEDFVSLVDLAPTFLEAAGLRPAAGLHGRSLMRLLEGKPDRRDKVFVERERHANVREGNLSYPMRAVRTREFLYIRNLRPDRWPAGDPPAFGDIDPGPTKEVVLARRDRSFDLACAKRPAEELYDLRKDPGELDNVAAKAEYAEAKRKLRTDLDAWMKNTGDPRAVSDDDRWDQYPYVGGGGGRGRKKK